MVKIENLVKRYGSLLALDHFNIEVKEGEIFGLLGPNGSGKTTAINCILSLLKFDRGSIRIMGEEMTPDNYRVKREIGIVMQDVAVFEELNVWDNIDCFCGLYVKDKKKRRELVEEAIRFVGLEDYRKSYPKKLSGGLLRRLNIACGIAHKPRLIILDEPTVAVDPQSRNKILEGICQMNRQGSTIIYTSHYMEEVEQICSRIAILDKGRCLALGTKEELKNMIKTGEKVHVEGIHLTPEQLEVIRHMPQVFSTVYEEGNLTLLKQRNFRPPMEQVPCFYGRGIWDLQVMSLVDRTLCKLLQKSVAKKPEGECQSWELALRQAGENRADWTHPDYLQPVLEWLEKN